MAILYFSPLGGYYAPVFIFFLFFLFFLLLLNMENLLRS